MINGYLNHVLKKKKNREKFSVSNELNELLMKKNVPFGNLKIANLAVKKRLPKLKMATQLKKIFLMVFQIFLVSVVALVVISGVTLAFRMCNL